MDLGKNGLLFSARNYGFIQWVDIEAGYILLVL